MLTIQRDILIRFSVAVGILALAGSVSGALSVEEQVKKLAARYAQVEDQLARSVRYASRDDKGNSEQACFNGADDLIKLAVESHDGDVRELTEYFALDFDNDYDDMFMLVRKETPAPDGGVQVEESRKNSEKVRRNSIRPPKSKAIATIIASFMEARRRTDDLPSRWDLRANRLIGTPCMTKRPRVTTPRAWKTFAITLSILPKRKSSDKPARAGLERVAVTIIPNVLSRGRPTPAFSCSCWLTSGRPTIA